MTDPLSQDTLEHTTCRCGPFSGTSVIPITFSGQLEALVDLPFLNHVLDVIADEAGIGKW
jgi:hypothetical protein